MTDHGELNGSDGNFLVQLYEQTQGDPSVQVSMYAIGETMGLERGEAKHAAEALIAMGMVEIRTLSGGIGITEAGAEAALKTDGRLAGGPGGLQLGGDPIVTQDVCRGLDGILADLKGQVGALNLPFDDLSEIITDLKTIDVQLTSSRPKTAIVRECFRSVRKVLEKAGALAGAAKVKALLAD